jgi:urease accessory protein
MQRDALGMRGDRPFVFTNLKKQQGLDLVESFIISAGILEAA